LRARTLDGETPDAVSRLPLDLLDQLGLSEALGMTRTQGLTAILHRVKSSVASATS
jgi:sulfur transfer protein SufE